jgi:flavin-dependent dehydrogenase
MEKVSTTSGLGPLADGGKVVIIGGGPGGVAAGHALIEMARTLGRRLTVTVVEGKQFSEEHHYNQCVGVLSPPIAELMERDLGLPFPKMLAQRDITGYILHAGGREITLDGESAPSVALRRVQFDAYMLEAACLRGIHVQTARATGLEFHPDRVVVYTENAPIIADVVIGAFGLDEGTGALFQHTVGYRHPPALSSIVTKFHPGEGEMLQFGNRIHAFLPRSPRIEFGGITPKGNHLTVNIAGRAVDSDLMDAFLSMSEVRRVLPGFEQAGRIDPGDLRYFKSSFPCGQARNYTGDRFVMVGDAAGLVRAFKGKGVTSAILTGARAARVILQHGISAQAFQGYHVANRDITGDLPIGQAMRLMTILAARMRLLGVVIRAAESDQGLRLALFNAVSAHQSYQQVLRQGLTFNVLRALLTALLTKAE